MKLALAVILLAAPVHAAPLALSIENGKLAGPGGEMLRAQLADAQLVLLGEDHGFADAPIIGRAIAKAASSKYLVVETGPLTAKLVADTLARGGIAALHGLVHGTPLGIPFLSLEDDARLAMDFLGADAQGTPRLWGIDQEFIGSPPIHLRRLISISPNAAVQKLLDAEIDAATKGAPDKFLLATASAADFAKLAAQYTNPEALRIIAELAESAAIYQLWMHDHNYENNARRARLLAKNFLDDYKAAGDPEPRVMFKMGIEHVGIGTTPNNTTDIGTVATELARSRGKPAVRIAFLPSGGHALAFAPKPGNPTSIEVYTGPEANELLHAIGVAPLATGWTLIPLEPIRQALDTKGLDKLSPMSRFLVLGFDYLITTPDAKAGKSLY